MVILGNKKNDDGWTGYEFKTTYKMGWHNCIFLMKALYPHLINPQVLISQELNTGFDAINVKQEDDFFVIGSDYEATAIELRGMNKLFDNVMFQIEAFNQTDIVRFFVPTSYMENVSSDDLENMHYFDNFMDSIEINASVQLDRFVIGKEIIDNIVDALIAKENFLENRTYRYEPSAGYGINLNKICNAIYENGKEIKEMPKYNNTHTTGNMNYHPKTGGEEAVGNVMNILSRNNNPKPSKPQHSTNGVNYPVERKVDIQKPVQPTLPKPVNKEELPPEIDAIMSVIRGSGKMNDIDYINGYLSYMFSDKGAYPNVRPETQEKLKKIIITQCMVESKR